MDLKETLQEEMQEESKTEQPAGSQSDTLSDNTVPETPSPEQPESIAEEIASEETAMLTEELGSEEPDATPEEAAQNETKKKTAPLWRQVWWFLRPTVIACILLLIVTQFFIMYAHVPTGSMQETIQAGSYIFANRRAYDSATPQRGDVIVFETDQSNEKYLVKRVIGVAGDHIELIDGKVYINGSLYEEDYVTSETYPYVSSSVEPVTEYTVPEGCVFVLGDNRQYSMDARQWKDPYLPVENIRGEVFCTFSIAEWYFRAV